MLKVSFGADTPSGKGGVVVLTVAESQTLGPRGKDYDRKSQGWLKRAIESAEFTGKKGETLVLPAPSGLGWQRLVLLGIGRPAVLDAMVAESIGGALTACLDATHVETASLVIDISDKAGLEAGVFSAHLAYGALLRSWSFDKYRTKRKPQEGKKLAQLNVMTVQAPAAKRAFAPLIAVAEGVFMARALVCEPPNVLGPQELAQEALTLKKLGVDVEVLDEKALRKLGMGALLGVGQGSVRPSSLVVMRWNGAKSTGGGKAAAKASRPIALVGKGVCFDSGGLSLKPAESMMSMKYDMAGAAAVIGTMRALASRNAKVDVVGVTPLVENMPSGSAQRPDDVVTSLSGQTIEVLNTDAEGRLILADALWYTKERFKPRYMVNLATLTGAIVISLGHDYAGLFSNSDMLSSQLIEAGREVEEKLWRMPLSPVGESYDKEIDSDIADMKNIQTTRGAAGSVTAAQFLQRFVSDTPWAHLDVAGMVWSKKDMATCGKGATGYGVRLLNHWIMKNFE